MELILSAHATLSDKFISSANTCIILPVSSPDSSTRTLRSPQEKISGMGLIFRPSNEITNEVNVASPFSGSCCLLSLSLSLHVFSLLSAFYNSLSLSPSLFHSPSLSLSLSLFHSLALSLLITLSLPYFLPSEPVLGREIWVLSM